MESLDDLVEREHEDGFSRAQLPDAAKVRCKRVGEQVRRKSTGLGEKNESIQRQDVLTHHTRMIDYTKDMETE